MIKRFLGYSGFGILAYSFDLLLIYTFVTVGVPYFVAVPVAFLIATSGHYVGIRLTVFSDTERGAVSAYAFFILIMGANAVLVTILVAGLVEYAALNLYIARTLVAGLVGLLSFYLNTRYNFKIA
jgi:putative flippase GtrA